MTTIAQGFGYNCTGLTEVEIPETVTSIGASALRLCTGMTKVICRRRTPPTLGGSAFSQADFPIYVPAISVDAYKTAWPTLSSRIFAIDPEAIYNTNGDLELKS